MGSIKSKFSNDILIIWKGFRVKLFWLAFMFTPRN